MNEPSLISVDVNQRVWSFGYAEHGPVDGPKVHIDGNQAGTIARREPRFSVGPFSGGPDLFVVEWDNGQVSKHYAQELFPIGPFETLKDFEAAFARAVDAELELGPQGGFVGFKATITKDDAPLMIQLDRSERRHWRDYLEPLVRQLGLQVREKTRPRRA